MRSYFFIILFWSISIANVLSLQNNSTSLFLEPDLTFFGEYVIFQPATQYIKFDLYEEIDILLMAHRTTKPNTRLTDIHYAYRIHLVLDDETDGNPDTYRVNCTIYREGKAMFAGHYEFWNKTEKNNMGIRWGSSERNNLEVLTELDGNSTIIFSWKDRSKNHTVVKYVGLAVEPVSTEANITRSHRHLNWKIREADSKGEAFRNFHKICIIKILPAHPLDKPAYIYQFQVTKEEENVYVITLERNSKEILRKKTVKVIDPEDIVVSWDAEKGLISFGLQNDTTPMFLCKDDEANKFDFNRMKFVSFHDYTRNSTKLVDYTNSTFRSIPELYPEYFTVSPALVETASELTIVTGSDSAKPDFSSRTVSRPNDPDADFHFFPDMSD